MKRTAQPGERRTPNGVPPARLRSIKPQAVGPGNYLGNLSTMINSSPQVQLQRKLAEEIEIGSRHKNTPVLVAPALGVVQAKWVPGRAPFLMWTPAIDGYTWWFNQDDRTMAYTPESVRDLSPEEAEKLTWRPHKEWQIEALENIDPDAQKPATFKFEELVAKGKSRWLELEKAMLSGGGVLDPPTQAARDWFFREYYTTTTSQKGGGQFDVASNYNARPKSYETKRAKGEYTGTLSFGEGNMRLDQTYALGGPGEVYYNPKTGNAERMPPSEVLFQQWRGAAGGQRAPRLRVKEESVAGDGWKMLKVIRQGLKEDLVLKPGDDRFLAMLAVPNVTAAIFLIRDHGIELGISTIAQIVVQKNSHILIYFG